MNTQSLFFSHFQAVMKRTRNLGLLRYLHDNRNGVRRLVYGLMTLALLNEVDIATGFLHLSNNVPDYTIVSELLTYYQSYSLLQQGPSAFSVHGAFLRTSNFCEAFFSMLAHQLPPNCAFFRLVDFLRFVCCCNVSLIKSS